MLIWSLSVIVEQIPTHYYVLIWSFKGYYYLGFPERVLRYLRLYRHDNSKKSKGKQQALIKCWQERDNLENLTAHRIFCRLLHDKVMSLSKPMLLETKCRCKSSLVKSSLYPRLSPKRQIKYDFYLAKSRSASLDMVMLVRFCCRTKMFLHIFLIPDSLILLKYWAPLIRIQEIRCPRPSEREATRGRTHLLSAQRRHALDSGTRQSVNRHDTSDRPFGGISQAAA